MTTDTAASVANLPQSAANRLSAGIFSLTLCLSAALMFAIQPMAGKMLLPIVGGTPAGWIVAMAFFQAMLLAGYLLAHIFSKFSPRMHAALYLCALAAGAWFLPIDIRQHAAGIGDAPGPWDIFQLLCAALAFPFIALSATSSTIQRLFTTTGHASAHDPYFLYVASNIGSFAGLLLYPFVLEPLFSLSEQAGFSTAAYAGLFLGGALCLCISLAGKKPAAATADHSAPAGPARKLDVKRYAEWALLAFVPSSLLLGVTIYITTDIMSVPLMWVLPLCLYLLTFIIAFSKKTFIRLETLQGLQIPVVILSILLICIARFSFMNQWFGIFFYLTVFLVVTLAYHVKLASLRPLEENSRDLTGFYLMMSVGGAAGGIINAFIIPTIADRMIEFPLVLAASLMALPAFRLRSISGMITVLALLLTALTLPVTPPQFALKSGVMAELVFFAAFVMIMVYVLSKNKYLNKKNFIAGCATLLLLSQFLLLEENVTYTNRNFYGTIRVFDRDVTIKGKEGQEDKHYTIKFIHHGTTVHGSQILEPKEMTDTVTSYYNPSGPLGDIFRLYQPERVAVIGLGAGVVSCHHAPSRHFTFFEIDPAMVYVAQNHFTFLKECRSGSEPRIIVGDGRLELSRLKDETFDLIIVDAFSSDSIPVHLLTLDALRDYMARLDENGLIALHLSNRFFVLEQQVAAIAAELELHNAYKFHRQHEAPVFYPSKWMVVSRQGMEDKLSAENGWAPFQSQVKRVWTDDYSNITSVLEFKTHRTSRNRRYKKDD